MLSTVWVKPLSAMARELHEGVDLDFVQRNIDGLPRRWHTETAAAMFDTVAVCLPEDSWKMVEDDVACVNEPGKFN